MKNLIKGVSILLFLSIMACSAPAQTRIGTIDLRKVFDNYWKTKQAQTDLKDREATMMKDLKGYEGDLNKAGDEYQKLLSSASDNALSTDERDKRKASAEAKLREINEIKQAAVEYRRSASVTLEEFMTRRREALLKEIRAVVESKAKAASYAMVVDVSAEGLSKTPIILYSNNESDLTEAVLTQVNATAPVDLTKPQPAKDQKKP